MAELSLEEITKFGEFGPFYKGETKEHIDELIKIYLKNNEKPVSSLIQDLTDVFYSNLAQEINFKNPGCLTRREVPVLIENYLMLAESVPLEYAKALLSSSIYAKSKGEEIRSSAEEYSIKKFPNYAGEIAAFLRALAEYYYSEPISKERLKELSDTMQLVLTGIHNRVPFYRRLFDDGFKIWYDMRAYAMKLEEYYDSPKEVIEESLSLQKQLNDATRPRFFELVEIGIAPEKAKDIAQDKDAYSNVMSAYHTFGQKA